MARGRPCGVCKSEFRAQIDLGLASGISYKVLAERFGIGRDSILRHAKHLSPAAKLALAANTRLDDPLALEGLRAKEGASLLANLIDQRCRLRALADAAAAIGDFAAANGAEKAITRNLEVVGRLVGELINRSEVRTTSLLISPDYHRLRCTLIETLRPFPVAAQAVAAALHCMENEALASPQPAPEPKLIEATALPRPLPPWPPLPQVPPKC